MSFAKHQSPHRAVATIAAHKIVSCILRGLAGHGVLRVGPRLLGIVLDPSQPDDSLAKIHANALLLQLLSEQNT